MKISIASKIKKYINYFTIVSFFYSVFELSYVYVIIRESSYKLLLLIFIAPIFMFNRAFIEYYQRSRLPFNKKYKRYVFGLVVFILSILFTASINVNLFNMNLGVMSVPANVGLILLSSQFIVMVITLLYKVNIAGNNESKPYAFLLYSLPSLLILGFLFLVYYPGNCSADSIAIWQDVKSNVYGDAHPIIYMMLIKGLSLLWDNIAVISLFNMLITVFTFGYVSYQLDKLGVNRVLCIIISIVLPLFPANALYSVTAWKDIPYTMGLIVLSIMIYKCVTTDYYKKKSSLYIMFDVSLFTLFVRHNAIISVFLGLFFMGVYFIFKLDKKNIVKTLILGAMLVIAFFGIRSGVISLLSSSDNNNSENSTIVEENADDIDIDSPEEVTYTGGTLLHFQFPKVIPLQQVIYTDHFVGDEFTDFERETFEKVVVSEELEKHKQKYAENDIWMFYFKPDKIDSYKYSTLDFWDTYFSLYERYPTLMNEGYKKITSIVWCSSSYGSVAYRADSVLSLEDALGREFPPIIKHGIMYKLDNLVFKYMDSSFASVFWRPALFFILSLVLLVVVFKKHGAGGILFFLPTLFNQVTYLLVTASQDTRYTYINYTIFVIMLALAITPKIIDSAESEQEESNI